MPLPSGTFTWDEWEARGFPKTMSNTNNEGELMKNAPKTLHELLEMIVEYDNPDQLGNYMTSEEFADHKTIPPWQGAPMAHGELDMSSLPNFGGPEPSDPTGIWSWDATRLLVGDGSADLVIVERTFETPNHESDESIMRNEAKEEN